LESRLAKKFEERFVAIESTLKLILRRLPEPRPRRKR
jgi:hypothetical protein